MRPSCRWIASLAWVAACALQGCAASGIAHLPASSAPSEYARRTASSATGVVIPMYAYPGKVWDSAIAAKRAHPNVPFALIADVDNGPGKRVDPNYVSAIVKAQKAGIWVLGYVYTNYSKRALSAVEADVRVWRSFYHPDGIFIDEMSSSGDAYTKTLSAYAHAKNFWFVMGNPGTNAPGDAGPDVIDYFEGKGYPALSYLRQPAHVAYGKKRWSFIAGAVPYDASTIAEASKYVAYLYATDASEPECYCKLPSYFNQLVAQLGSLAREQTP